MTGPTTRDLVASPSQTVGPFFHFGLTTNEAQGRMAGPHTPGERIRVRVRVLRREPALTSQTRSSSCGRRTPMARTSSADHADPDAGAVLPRLGPAADGRGRRVRVPDDSSRRASAAATAVCRPRTSTSACSCAACSGTSTRASILPATPHCPTTARGIWYRPSGVTRCWPTKWKLACGLSISTCRVRKKRCF